MYNSWAYIRNGVSNASIKIKLYDLPLKDGLDHDELKASDVDGNGIIPLADGILIRSNGDQEDNKEEIFIFISLAGRMIKVQVLKAISSFLERRTVTAYRDFGRLKVMPAIDFIVVE